MSDWASWAGIVPVTPTKWSSGWFTCSRPNFLAAATSAPNEVPGFVKTC